MLKKGNRVHLIESKNLLGTIYSIGKDKVEIVMDNCLVISADIIENNNIQGFKFTNKPIEKDAKIYKFLNSNIPTGTVIISDEQKLLITNNDDFFYNAIDLKTLESHSIYKWSNKIKILEQRTNNENSFMNKWSIKNYDKQKEKDILSAEIYYEEKHALNFYFRKNISRNQVGGNIEIYESLRDDLRKLSNFYIKSTKNKKIIEALDSNERILQLWIVWAGKFKDLGVYFDEYLDVFLSRYEIFHQSKDLLNNEIFKLKSKVENINESIISLPFEIGKTSSIIDSQNNENLNNINLDNENFLIQNKM